MVRLTARSGTDFVFIQHAGLCALYTAGKYAALSLPGHGHTLPAVEFSNQLHSLCVRSFNCLKRAGINTVEDLINKSEDEMMKVRNLGRKSLEEVMAKLDSLGFTLTKDDE